MWGVLFNKNSYTFFKILGWWGYLFKWWFNSFQTQAVHVLLTSTSPTSSFVKVRNLLLLYHLSHPFGLLHYPPPKDSLKKLVESKMLEYWEVKFRAKANLQPSLTYFHPQFISMTFPHKIWTIAGSNSYNEVAKARVQLIFMSSQYPCAKLTRHWSRQPTPFPTNIRGSPKPG